MPSFSIDLAAERIVEKRSQNNFEEVVRCFATGCYRSSIVMLWTVVVCDLVYKLQNLRDMHGDVQADKLLKDVEKKQLDNPSNPEWELYLLNEVVSRTKLLEAAEHIQLQGLQKLRHLSAHPVLTGSDLLFQPSKETARANIRTALEAVLLKPPLFSKKIVPALVADIATNKALLISTGKLKSYLEARYFPNMPGAVELELFRSLWKFCFKLRNIETDTHRDINVVALGVIYERNPAMFRAAMDGDRIYFSNVGPDPELLEALIHFLAEHRALYGSLNSAAHILLQGQAAGDINLRIKSWFQYPSFAAHLAALHSETADAFDDVSEKSWALLLDESASEGVLQTACEIAIKNYGACVSYDDADKRFGRFVAPMLGKVDATRMTALLKEIDKNSQIYDRRRAKIDHREVVAAASNLSVDTSPYKNFLANV